MIKYEWTRDDCRNYAAKLKSIVRFDHARMAKMISGKISRVSGQTIVDIASGPGFLLFELGKYLKDCKLVAQDASAEMLKIAEEKGNDYGMKAEFYCCPAEQLNLNTESADVVTCKQLLHEADDPRKVILEIYRIMKKGGDGFIIDFDADGNKFAARMIKVFMRIVCGNKMANTFWSSFSAGLKGSEIVGYLKELNVVNTEYIKSGPSYFITFKK